MKNITIGILATGLALSVVGPAIAQDPADELTYVAVSPCRVADTRQSAEGVLKADTTRNFKVTGSAGDLGAQGGTSDCPNPKDGRQPVAVAAYILAVPANSSSDKGVLSVYPSDEPPPPAGSGSTVNFALGQTIGNTTIATICSGGDCPSGGELAVLARKTDEHVVIDIQGYFYAETVPGYQIFTAGFVAANSTQVIRSLECPSGRRPLGGGGEVNDSSWYLSTSAPTNDGKGWRIRYNSTGASFSATGSIWVICAATDG